MDEDLDPLPEQAWANVASAARKELKYYLDENAALKDLILQQLSLNELKVLLGDSTGTLMVENIQQRYNENRRDAFDLDPNIPNLVERLTLLKEEKELVNEENEKVQKLLLEFLSPAELQSMLPPPYGTKGVKDFSKQKLPSVLAPGGGMETSLTVLKAKAEPGSKEAFEYYKEQSEAKEDLIVKLKAYIGILEERMDGHEELIREAEHLKVELERKKEHHTEMNEMIASLQENIEALMEEKDGEIDILTREVADLKMSVDPNVMQHLKTIGKLTGKPVAGGAATNLLAELVDDMPEPQEDSSQREKMLHDTVDLLKESLRTETEARQHWEKQVKEYADQVQVVSGCLLETSDKAIEKDKIIEELTIKVAMVKPIQDELQVKTEECALLEEQYRRSMAERVGKDDVDSMLTDLMRMKASLEAQLKEVKLQLEGKNQTILDLTKANEHLREVLNQELGTGVAERGYSTNAREHSMLEAIAHATALEEAAFGKDQLTRKQAAEQLQLMKAKVLNQKATEAWSQNVETVHSKTHSRAVERAKLEAAKMQAAKTFNEAVPQEEVNVKAAKADSKKESMLALMSERLKRLEDLSN
uniref:Uncharacterized protein n=1 Tax=Pyramimonas obovata TaxID=1411642 RepID=A0A7S0N6A9_9CHLO|mmetsp:Transcript_21814/g.47885  ORF Transcript_21814/g.47885 Transcript_21814/m.47885 type:complete len:590 (+) Transcript_21814:155-1924(+)|eukprot:CAMPEP_0118940074 /NCGR_PEP_ID=MMETSP1169-20130426/30540_1 /TAXON_ID=36882 /ORGANISM="Pyramimonas obovata, Strain CCMP722" /LENGTH=589 /DNA_ID=CAMNT_0006884471 /DNA_START=71 /DNA_END=1840 /DNA_ORIENTATION=+